MATISDSIPAWPMSPNAYSLNNELLSAEHVSSNTTPMLISVAHTPPEKNDSFLTQTSSNKEMSFTPKRAKAPPRAWERRPATPYVPRNEGQKIWKRVPLGEVQIDPSLATISRKEEKEQADYVRTVKRLKVDQAESRDASSNSNETEEEVGSNSDKENSRVHQHREPVGISKQPKTIPNHEFTFVSTKTEHNIIEAGASPRKKVRMPGVLVTDDYDDGRQLQLLDGQATNATLPIEEQETVITVHESGLTTPTATAEFHSKRTEVAAVGQASHLSSDGDTTSHTQSESAQAQSAISDENANSSQVKISFDVVPESLSSGTIAIADDGSVSKDGGKEEDTAVQPAYNDPLTTQAYPSLSDLESSPQRDCIELSEAEIEMRVAEQDVDSNNEQKTGHNPLTTSTVLVDDDDTAFLHDFLSRAKAARAARENEAQNVLPKQVPSSTAADTDTQSSSIGDDADIDYDDEMFHLGNEAPILDMPQDDQELPPSPLRRSTRAATVRSTAQTSRTKTLPNAIQLKRANGNEFIFTANQAQGAANVALLTRTNTKRNKGTSANVGDRLRQLCTQKDDSSQQTSEVLATEEVSSADSADAKMNTSKKRKREKGEKVSKAKKALRWNEEELVRYRDPSPMKDTEEHEFTKLPEESAPITENEDRDRARAFGASDDVELPNVDVSADVEDKTGTKVRRVRRGVAGTVNGTPAPKKRSKNMLLEEENDNPTEAVGTTKTEFSEETASATVNGKASSVGTTMTRKSRMPVPVGTPGKQLRPVAATMSAKPSNAEFSVMSKPAASTGTQATAGANQKQDVPPSTSSKRRLRVRV